jgi:hypothetical protein
MELATRADFALAVSSCLVSHDCLRHTFRTSLPHA